MFSGIGGFELGIQRASNQSTNEERQQTEPDQDMRQVQQWETVPEVSRSIRGNGDADKGERSLLPTDDRGIRSVCVGYSEIDKYAIKVYERQFNGDNRPDLRNGAEEIQNNSTNSTERKDRTTSGHTNYGDATKINAAELPDFDLLVGGFPCQAFSVAGKRQGFDDTRGTLFFDIARVLKEKRPRHLVLENVKGLLSHDQGKTFQTILGVLSDLGYRVEWQVLNSKDFGVPQNRERIFIIGHLRGECGRKVFPIRQDAQVSTKRQGKVSPTITSRYYKQGQSDPYIVDEEKPRIRKLTPKECERLQGFPDDWAKEGVEWCLGERCTRGKMDACLGHFVDISDTQRYKMCGNAVTTNTVQAVMERLFSHE